MPTQTISKDGAALTIWRDAPNLDGLKTAAIGAFSTSDTASGAALITEAVELLSGEGFGAILGPMDGDTWASYRFVIDSDGRPPFLMEPKNPDWYPKAFDAAGFKMISQYVSAARPITQQDIEPEPRSDVVVRPIQLRIFREELLRIHALSLAAFQRNAFYKPVGAERFLASYLPFQDRIDPNMVLMAESTEGELLAYLFAIPNFAEGARPASMIVKTYASTRKGLGAHLADAIHAIAQKKGYQTAIHALMHESNRSLRQSEDRDSRVFRRYALWGKRL